MASFQNFEVLDIRVGKILYVEDFIGAKIPAYKIKADFGPEIGIKWTSAQAKPYYSAKELEGMLIIGLVNIPQKKVAGFASEFLMLAAKKDDGSPALLQPGKAAEPGSRIY